VDSEAVDTQEDWRNKSTTGFSLDLLGGPLTGREGIEEANQG
jgi:hypothetical protein